jgi:hypothetical protein
VAVDITVLAHPLAECVEEVPVRGCRFGAEKRDAWYRSGRLLRPRRQRPCRCRAADKRDEIAAFHSITSSARNKIDVGTVSPSARAALRLTTSSNCVGC